MQSLSTRPIHSQPQSLYLSPFIKPAHVLLMAFLLSSLCFAVLFFAIPSTASFIEVLIRSLCLYINLFFCFLSGCFLAYHAQKNAIMHVEP